MKIENYFGKKFGILEKIEAEEEIFSVEISEGGKFAVFA